MDSYRVVPRGGKYRVEAVAPDGTAHLVDACYTEELAVSRLRALQERAEKVTQVANPGERDWRG
jgi:hypothetical protein